MNYKKHLTKDNLIELAEKITRAGTEVRVSDYKGSNKFTEEERFFLVSMIARCFSTREIQMTMLEHYNKTIKQQQIDTYKRCKKWQPVIRKVREEFNIDIASATFSSKRSRLEVL